MTRETGRSIREAVWNGPRPSISSSATVYAEDSYHHLRHVIRSLYNAHMATPARSELLARFCADKHTLAPELEAIFEDREA